MDLFFGVTVQIKTERLLRKRNASEPFVGSVLTSPVNRILKRLGLLPLPSLYIYEICNFVYNNKELFKKVDQIYSRNRDPCRLLLQDTPKSAKYSKSFLVMCVRIYNKIPKEIKLIYNNNSFKIRLYKWLNEYNFYDIKDFFDIKL